MTAHACLVELAPQDTPEIALEFDTLSASQIIGMLDILPDVLTWVKDKHSRYIYANQGFLRQIGLECAQKLRGKTDADIFPKHIARKFLDEDRRIMSGLAQNKSPVEPELTPGLDFTKRPLLDQQGHVVGLYGVGLRAEANPPEHRTHHSPNNVLSYIELNIHNELTVKSLASAFHLSVSALERRSKKQFNKTPSELIRKARLDHARQLIIETNYSIIDIALQSGYTHHSYFTKQYKSYYNELPSHTRTRHEKLNR